MTTNRERCPTCGGAIIKVVECSKFIEGHTTFLSSDRDFQFQSTAERDAVREIWKEMDSLMNATRIRRSPELLHEELAEFIRQRWPEVIENGKSRD